MADLGFLPAVTQIIDQTPADGQRMLFSATLDRNVGQLVTRYTTDAALHAVTSSTDSGPAEHRVLVLSAQDKVAVAAEIASQPRRTLFFIRTKHGADRLVKQLTRAGVEAAAIHGDRNQNQRQRALDAFAAGYPRVLVATDVAARGIHVDDVNLVVQFDPPNDHKDYLHRSGRTARAGASGMVIALVERGQLRELRRLHDAAGVTAASDEVAAGHHVVRQIAASGTPIPPAPVRPHGRGPHRSARPPRGGIPAAEATASAAPAARPASARAGADAAAAAPRAGSSSRAGGGARTGSGRRAARGAAGGREDAGRGTARGAAQGAANPAPRSQSHTGPTRRTETSTPRSRPERSRPEHGVGRLTWDGPGPALVPPSELDAAWRAGDVERHAETQEPLSPQ